MHISKITTDISTFKHELYNYLFVRGAEEGKLGNEEDGWRCEAVTKYIQPMSCAF